VHVLCLKLCFFILWKIKYLSICLSIVPGIWNTHPNHLCSPSISKGHALIVWRGPWPKNSPLPALTTKQCVASTTQHVIEETSLASSDYDTQPWLGGLILMHSRLTVGSIPWGRSVLWRRRPIVVEQGLTSLQTHYRSYPGRVVWVKRHNQQCRSTEGREVLRTRLQSH